MEQYYPMRPIPRTCDCDKHYDVARQYDKCDRCDLSERSDMMPCCDKQVVAMAYVPDHKFEDLLEPEYAFTVGTIFKPLCKPFCGKGCR